MQKFSIKLDKRNLNKIFTAADKLVVVANAKKAELPKAGAEEYVNRVLKGINSVRYKYSGKYSKGYLDWKKENYGVHVPWKLEGDLVRVLKAYSLGGAGKTIFLGGVKAGIYDSGGKSWYGNPAQGSYKGPPKEIAMYGRAVEKYKPMFRPVWREYKPIYIKKFKKVVAQIRRIWR